MEIDWDRNGMLKLKKFDIGSLFAETSRITYIASSSSILALWSQGVAETCFWEVSVEEQTPICLQIASLSCSTTQDTTDTMKLNKKQIC